MQQYDPLKSNMEWLLIGAESYTFVTSVATCLVTGYAWPRETDDPTNGEDPAIRLRIGQARHSCQLTGM